MIETDIKVSCGCGFKSQLIPDGIIHTTNTGHTVQILGQIKNNKKVISFNHYKIEV